LTDHPLVILGAGMAGYGLARELRALDRDLPILVVTADAGEQYPKPQLSAALAKGQRPEQLIQATADQLAERLGLQIRTRTPVLAIDPSQRRLRTGEGEIRYDRLVLAVGARPIRLPLSGDGAGQVLSVNSLDDYRAYREHLRTARRIAIIGPGLIGCEFANDLVQSGHQVCVIGPDPHPIGTLLPEAAGRALQQAMAAAGVDWRLGVTTDRAERLDAGYRLPLSDGGEVRADLVVSAVGLRPDTRLAEAAGLDCGRGIRTDRYLQSSDPHIYALGDCVEVAGLNLPFVMPLNLQAKALARTLCGQPTELQYPAMPVLIKTTLHPVVVAPPPRDADGAWQTEVEESGVLARFMGGDGRLLGFALTGAAVSQRQRLQAELPPTL